jgi:hypothetical protein
MNPRARIALVLVALVGVGAFALLSGGSEERNAPEAFPTSTNVPTLPTGCVEERPAKVDAPAWFPSSMPLPKGSYFHDVPDQIAPGVDTAQLFMPASLDDFVQLVLSSWEDAGWIPGIGEREPGEAETTFVGPDDRYGQFRAQAFYCDTNTTNLYIAFATREPEPTDSPS